MRASVGRREFGNKNGFRTGSTHLEAGGVMNVQRGETPLHDILRQRELWRQQQECVVFTNGCFDALHRGHQWLFEQAREMGRHLIVAVNSDEYCRRVKGVGRPTQPSRLRRKLVGATSQAEFVLELLEDDPSGLLQMLRPDVYVLGADYRGMAIPGAECCGRIVFVDRLPGLSTTENLRHSRPSPEREPLAVTADPASGRKYAEFVN